MVNKIKHFQWTDSSVFVIKNREGLLNIKKRYHSHINKFKLDLYHTIHRKESICTHIIRLSNTEKEIFVNWIKIETIYYHILDLGEINIDEITGLLVTTPQYVDQIDLNIWELEEYRLKWSIAEHIKRDLSNCNMPFMKKLMIVPQNIRICRSSKNSIYIIITDLAWDITQFIKHYKTWIGNL